MFFCKISLWDLRGRYNNHHHQVRLHASPHDFALLVVLNLVNLAVQHQNRAHIQAEDQYVDCHL